MAFRKRAYSSTKKIWIYGTGGLVALLSLFIGLTAYGVDIEVSGDIVCTECISYFNVSLQNYSICWGKGFEFYLNDSSVDYVVQKADRRYRSDNLNRWKDYDFLYGKCLDAGIKHEFRVLANKSADSTIKWGVNYELDGMDPLWLPTGKAFDVRFHSCSHGLTEHSCLIDIQNLNSVKKNFNLSMLLSDTNYNLEEFVTSMTIKEWKAIDTEFPTYAERLVEKICWNYDNVTLVNISYDCSYMENYQSGTEIKSKAQWKETKVNPEMFEEGKKQKMSYGLINIPNYDSKAKYDASGIIETVKGTKTFLIEWTTPITETESGWGSSGKIAIVNELTGEEYE